MVKIQKHLCHAISKSIFKQGEFTPFVSFVTKTHIDQNYEPFFYYNLYCQQFDQRKKPYDNKRAIEQNETELALTKFNITLVEQNSSSAISKIDQARLKMKNDYGQGCQNRLHQNATLQLAFYTLSYCMMVALLYKKPNHVFQSLMRTNEDKTSCIFRN